MMYFPESDNSNLPDIESFVKEIQEQYNEEEMDKSYFERIQSIKVGHWVLCKFATKRRTCIL